MRVLSFVVVALLVASAVAVSGDNKPEPKHRRAAGAVPARPLGSHLERVFPRVDTKLLRRSSRVVLVPKGDPRARPPTTPATPALASRRYSARTAHRGPVPSVPVTPAVAVPVAPAVAVPVAVGQKAPHIPRKPTQPTNPAHPTGTPGVNVGAAAPVAPTLKASAPAPVPSSSGSCLGGFNGATLATRALAYQSSYRNNGVVYSQPQRQFGASPPVHFADCSSFVTSVLDSLGWNCLFAAGRTTAAMLPIMEARGGFKQTAQKGDIVMWSGHTGIVVEACTGGSVRMVAMGTHGAADTGCITVEKLKGWGAGVFKGFWSPK